MARIQQPNTPAIEFALPGGDGRPITLSEYRGKNVMLVFYPADWSPVCTSELSLIQETLEDIRAYDAEVLALSVDSPFSHRAWAEHQHLTFPLLSDFWPHGAVARSYGVFRESDGTSDRALFFIDKESMLREAWIADDPSIAPGLNIIFDALARIQQPPRQEARHA